MTDPDGLSGWVLVPREPTEAMQQPGCPIHTPGQPMAKDYGECPSFVRRRNVWASMIAASPPIPNGLAEAIARIIDLDAHAVRDRWPAEHLPETDWAIRRSREKAAKIITLLTGAESK